MKNKKEFQKRNIHIFFQNILIFIKTYDISTVLFIVSVISFIFLIVTFLIVRRIYNGNIPEIINGLLWLCFSFLLGFGGVIQIIRKEAPGIMGHSIKGLLPILLGVVWVVFCWGLGIFLLLENLFQ